MKYLFTLALCALFMSALGQSPASKTAGKPYVIVIHGGAGVITPDRLTPEKEKLARATLEQALRAGQKVLAEGGSALDAITQAIVVMENSGVMNAGKGAVRTTAKKCELDASIMDGTTGQAGAVANVTTIKNPVLAARAVMEKTPHVLLIGKGAEAFAKQQGLEQVDSTYFINLLGARQKGAEDNAIPNAMGYDSPRKYGTVGALALDQQGRLAAATSTGGMEGKMPGRVGDAPIIGAGTFADSLVAVSCTGHGEYYIRNSIAFDIAARMHYQKATLATAANAVMWNVLERKGGKGGLIALDAKGNVAMPFNTPGMYRGYLKSDGSMEIAIYKEK
jgi:beta-aspartyl-peptidase (threonine type)